jgi:hypothetical protein
MITVSRQVNFGSRKTGLSTVGYTLLNENGSTKEVRTTSGVSELIAGSGAYGAVINFEDDWRGILIWDTGEATPLYAFDSFNYSDYSGGGGGGFVVQGEFLSQAEKEQVINLLKDISKTANTLNGRMKKVEDLAANLDSHLSALTAELQTVKESMRFDEVVKTIGLVDSSLTGILDSLKNTIILSEIRTKASAKALLESIVSHIQEAQLAISKLGTDKSLGSLKETLAEIQSEIELSIKMGAKLISTKDLQSILKEGGVNVVKILGK